MTTMNAIYAFPSQAEAWLDARGKPAWIAAMVLAFIVFWPVGLALLFYMIWSKRMFNRNSTCVSRRNARWNHAPMQHHNFPSSGNTAFDAYKSDMLRRLEDEQEAFETFLQRLRDAKDKSEFDAFMDDRARNAKSGDTAPEPKADH